MGNTCYRNSEGYSDPTACIAINNVERENEIRISAEDEDRFHKFLNTIFSLCDLSGFHIEERIVVKDSKTGKIWR